MMTSLSLFGHQPFILPLQETIEFREERERGKMIDDRHILFTVFPRKPLFLLYLDTNL